MQWPAYSQSHWKSLIRGKIFRPPAAKELLNGEKVHKENNSREHLSWITLNKNLS